jgi:hypothetical protein
MKRTLRSLAFCVSSLALASGAPAAEIILELPALDKLVTQALFTNAGRYDLIKGPCFAYLAQPSVSIQNGRVRIRSHLTSRLGVPSANACVVDRGLGQAGVQGRFGGAGRYSG